MPFEHLAVWEFREAVVNRKAHGADHLTVDAKRPMASGVIDGLMPAFIGNRQIDLRAPAFDSEAVDGLKGDRFAGRFDDTKSFSVVWRHTVDDLAACCCSTPGYSLRDFGVRPTAWGASNSHAMDDRRITSIR
ncbi:MAG: hypothetical protein CMP06_01755 [Xanthomonadales bacterium]|nr:hypothetical protein [Xanthomonadales bacterium]